MKIDLQRAVVYDTEAYANFWSLYAEELYSNVGALFVICAWRDDRRQLMQWFNYLHQNQIPMIGFNNLNYDQLMIDAIFRNPMLTAEQLREVNNSIINQPIVGFRKQIWPSERFAPQIDLMRIHHFDNKAKRTSLKALQINMRSEDVIESAIPFDKIITPQEAEEIVIPYNMHDVRQTKKFALFSQEALDMRISMLDTINGDVMNMSDTKIGGVILEQALGEELCYDRSSGKKRPRQTIRHKIALNDIIFPYISFENAEFNRVLNWMRGQVLTPDDLDDPDAVIKTKGVFKGVVAHVGGIEFGFGTGGIHASVTSRRFYSDDQWQIRDIDVKSLYPSIAIKNRLAPAHLGERFVYEYSQLPIRREEYQKKFGKKSVPANSMKLASNGTYGNSGSPYSVFYDPQFTMTITINGQLLLCMLAEKLLKVPTLSLIQVNTDGITYRVHRSMEWLAARYCKEWEAFTLLTLEDVNYSRMWIRDVNSYVAEDTDGNLKIKGAYWCPDEGETYAESISKSQPPAWHKDLGAAVCQRAAVAYLTKGTDIETFIRNHRDPFDFMCRVKVNKADTLLFGNEEIQRTSRYYVAVAGRRLKKFSPPTGVPGTYKKAPRVSDAEYNRLMAELPPGTHDPRIHTKNKSVHEERESQIEAGWNVAICNRASDFNFDNIDFRWYIAEAQKLVV